MPFISFFTGGNFTIFSPCTNDIFGFCIDDTAYSYLVICFSYSRIVSLCFYEVLFFSLHLLILVALFGNLFILPYSRYNNFVILADIVSSLNFLLLYIMNEKLKWILTTIAFSNKKSFSKPFLVELRD